MTRPISAPNSLVGELLQRSRPIPITALRGSKTAPTIVKHGAFPDAAFLVVMKPGFYTGSNLTGDLVTELPGSHGGHGFSPEFPEMRAAFFISGRGIARGRDLGLIDMRQIAPSLAQLLGVPLPTATAARLRLHP